MIKKTFLTVVFGEFFQSQRGPCEGEKNFPLIYRKCVLLLVCLLHFDLKLLGKLSPRDAKNCKKCSLIRSVTDGSQSFFLTSVSLKQQC